MTPNDSGNQLYYGDNLDVLRRYVASESVDLVYLDPPFKSNQDYNVLFAEKDGTRAAAQIKAFEDTWQWDQLAEAAYVDIVQSGGRISDVMQGFRMVLGQSDMMAYLSMMAPRLVELRRVLKITGSIYLHCDSTASHYLKMLMDSIFGVQNFRNEIIWKRTNVHNDSKTWSRVADVIFFYTKGNTFTWNPPHESHSEEYVSGKYRYDGGDGRKYRLDNMVSPNPRPNMMYEWKGFPYPAKGWRYSKETMARLDADDRIWYPCLSDGSFDTTKRPQLIRYLDEMAGPVMGTIWTDIRPINSQAAERLGYPTQKPEALLERIIQASSNEGDTVLDPFCGCGTAIAVAQRLGRRWIGIDITHIAITLMKSRLKDAFGEAAKFKVLGEPVSVQDAQTLADSDPYQFQWWALGLVGARPVEQKKGADKGIDGRLYFFDDASGKAQQVIFSVKAGHTSVAHVRDLVGVLSRENAAIGVLITMQEPTAPMRTEAATAGFYDSPGWNKRYPRLQIRTVGELLDGRGIDHPPVNQTFKQAPKAKATTKRKPLELFESEVDD